MSDTVIYKRILLKLSGEALKGNQDGGVDPDACASLARRIRDLHAMNIQVAVVIGGGNILRGATAKGIDRVTADNMGMLGTVINALALQAALEALNVPVRVQSAIAMMQICEPFIPRKAAGHLSRGRVVIFAAGMGSPFFTTDSTAALRANEIGAECILKATKVDGIYTADPKKDANATRYKTITYQEALAKRLQVMDSTAFSLCMDNNIPIIVFDFANEECLAQLVRGDFSAGTLVTA